MRETRARIFLSAIVLGSAIGCTSILGSFDVGGESSADAGGEAGGFEGGTDAGADGARSDGGTDADAALSCAADETACGGKCLNVKSFASDDKNCGRCGRACGGSACTAGQCGAVKLHDGPVSGIMYTTLSDQAVYWTVSNGNSSGELDRCPLSGCATPTVLATDSKRGFGGVAVDEAKNLVYFTKARSGDNSVPAIGTRAVATTGANPDDFWNGFTQISYNLAATDAFLFAVDINGVYRQAKGASLSSGYQMITLAGFSLGQPSVDAVNVYVGAAGAGDDVRLLACATTASTGCGSSPQTFVTGIATGQIVNIVSAPTGNAIYFGTYGNNGGLGSTNGAIYKCLNTGCTPNANPTPMLTTLGASIRLAIDDTYLYWTTNAEELWACPLSGCTAATATKLLTGVGAYGVMPGIGKDPFLYWVGYNGVYKVARP